MADERTTETGVVRRDRDDVLGRRRLGASTDRARVFGANSFSGVLDVVGGLLVLATLVAVTVMAVHPESAERESPWLDEAAVLAIGVALGLLLMALSRLVLYAKACAVLLAGVSDAEV